VAGIVSFLGQPPLHPAAAMDGPTMQRWVEQVVLQRLTYWTSTGFPHHVAIGTAKREATEALVHRQTQEIAALQQYKQQLEAYEQKKSTFAASQLPLQEADVAPVHKGALKKATTKPKTMLSFFGGAAMKAAPNPPLPKGRPPVLKAPSTSESKAGSIFKPKAEAKSSAVGKRKAGPSADSSKSAPISDTASGSASTLAKKRKVDDGDAVDGSGNGGADDADGADANSDADCGGGGDGGGSGGGSANAADAAPEAASGARATTLPCRDYHVQPAKKRTKTTAKAKAKAQGKNKSKSKGKGAGQTLLSMGQKKGLGALFQTSKCPNCSAQVKVALINKHLDNCLA
jgi:hypothetical protein